MNYARTQWKLALHWQGFFFFGELDARPCHIPVPPTRRRDDDEDEAAPTDRAAPKDAPCGLWPTGSTGIARRRTATRRRAKLLWLRLVKAGGGNDAMDKFESARQKPLESEAAADHVQRRRRALLRSQQPLEFRSVFLTA
jgi:hypothetical protein